MSLTALTAIGGWVATYFQGRQKITQKKVEGKIERIQRWEDRMAEGSMSSWKDEYWTIILSIPMILCFFPSMVVHIKAGFAALASMPDWYQNMLMLSIGASFGYRGFEKFTMHRRSNRPVVIEKQDDAPESKKDDK